MADRYGPQTPEINVILVRVGTLTPDELTALREAHREVWGYTGEMPPFRGPGVQAWNVLREALDVARRVEYPALGPAFADTQQTVLATGAAVGQFAIRDAVMATSARDLVAEEGWTQALHDKLMRPWLTVSQR